MNNIIQNIIHKFFNNSQPSTDDILFKKWLLSPKNREEKDQAISEIWDSCQNETPDILYGALVGIATMGFRYFGVYETGVCFALLAVNSVSALIDRTEERLYRLLHRLPSERKEAAE